MTHHVTESAFRRRYIPYRAAPTPKGYALRDAQMGILLAAVLMILVVSMLSACTFKKDDGEKVRDLEFTVMGEADIPQELQTILAEKKAQAFKMTYTDAENLYILVGYGPQPTGGYSIQVEELYLTDNAIVLDTELLGPEKGEKAAPETSYPLIIICTEVLEEPVIFK